MKYVPRHLLLGYVHEQVINGAPAPTRTRGLSFAMHSTPIASLPSPACPCWAVGLAAWTTMASPAALTGCLDTSRGFPRCAFSWLHPVYLSESRSRFAATAVMKCNIKHWSISSARYAVLERPLAWNACMQVDSRWKNVYNAAVKAFKNNLAQHSIRTFTT